MSDKITNEIHELLNAKVVSAETAQRIRDYFHQKKKKTTTDSFPFLGFWEPYLLDLELFLFLHITGILFLDLPE